MIAYKDASVKNASTDVFQRNATIHVTVRKTCKDYSVRNASNDVTVRITSKDVSRRNASADVADLTEDVISNASKEM
jgi:hypothetical protein